MKKFLLTLPVILLCGCAEVQEVATKVITDPNVIAATTAVATAAVATVEAAKTAALITNPEIAACVVAGTALLTAVGALIKKSKKQ